MLFDEKSPVGPTKPDTNQVRATSNLKRSDTVAFAVVGAESRDRLGRREHASIAAVVIARHDSRLDTREFGSGDESRHELHIERIATVNVVSDAAATEGEGVKNQASEEKRKPAHEGNHRRSVASRRVAKSKTRPMPSRLPYP